jgi:uncharacterized protein with NRDE domain
MCILMVVHKKVKGYPIVLAANRDEYLDRPTRGPHLLVQTPAVWGGQDVRAGGTWLGINAYGLVIGLTNRRMRDTQLYDPACRSRGLLCLEALQCRTQEQVIALVKNEPAHYYNPFNLLVVNLHEASWIAYDESLESHRLEVGIHILANGNIDDVDTVRIRRARYLLQHCGEVELQEFFPLLERVCQDHEVGVQERDTICMHRPQDNYGTVSSTIMAITPDLQGSIYRYAEGPPCVTAYKEYPLPFASVS